MTETVVCTLEGILVFIGQHTVHKPEKYQTSLRFSQLKISLNSVWGEEWDIFWFFRNKPLVVVVDHMKFEISLTKNLL